MNVLMNLNETQTVGSSVLKTYLILTSFYSLLITVHNGSIMTPKSILLPSQVKELTNNTELINTLCRLGHGISYTVLEEILTEVAFQKTQHVENQEPLPESIEKEVFSILVEDNIDRLEETLSGLYSSFVLYFFNLLLCIGKSSRH